MFLVAHNFLKNMGKSLFIVFVMDHGHSVFLSNYFNLVYQTQTYCDCRCNCQPHLPSLILALVEALVGKASFPA